ncbi:MAG: hypothetical protein E6K28_01390 [Gammaproteobacteria bacterium]|nr:MAG: hypothetical protein E6K28_01390 [Gammaproteobacteria bacterium]
MSAAGRSPAAAAAAQRTASGSRAGRAAASRAATTGTAGTWDSPCGVRACTRRRSADARRRAGANQELRGDEPMSAPAPTTRCLPPLTARRSRRTSTAGERGRDLLQRANRRWKSLLEAYQPPPLDPARDEALREYVTRRKRAMPDEPG